MLRKMTAFILIIAICLSFSGNLCYAASMYEGWAGDLKELGLFKGTDKGFELEQPCDRLMGAVLLTRFLGLEKEALSQNYSHPFLDVKDTYADKYIGLLYSKSLARGQSGTRYGTGEMTSGEFATLMLRALGYADQIDFTWDHALAKMADLNIITQAEASSLKNKKFIRDDAVFLCYKLLFAHCKGESSPLANKLLWDDVFSTTQLDNTKNGDLMLAADMPDLITDFVTVYNADSLERLILLSMRNNQLGIGISVPGMPKEQLQNIYDNIISDYHWKAVLGPSVTCKDGYIYPHIGISDYLMMEFYYDDPARYQKSYQFYRTDLIDYEDSFISLAEWAKKVDDIVNKNINKNMTEKEKVKALHDYLISNTEYDATYEGNAFMTPHFAEQVIFSGHGVCDGYAEAFKILMNGAGIKCKVIYGDTPYGLHAWNQVNVNGTWYNIDVTWDDPDSGNQVSYNYFCVSDSKFSLEHFPEEICAAEECPSDL